MICMASSRSVLANREVRVVIKCHKCTGETLVSQRKLKSTYSSSLETRDLIRRARGGARGRAFFFKSDDHRPTHAWMKNDKLARARRALAKTPPPPRGAVRQVRPYSFQSSFTICTDSVLLINKRARVSLTLRLIFGYLLRSLLPFLTCSYGTLLDLEIYKMRVSSVIGFF